MKKGEYFVDVAHINPNCPLSLSHARMFIIADTWVRYQRDLGKIVKFPISMHCSGSTPQKISLVIKNYLNRKTKPQENNQIQILKELYKVPENHLRRFTNPLAVLRYFSNQIVNDLKAISISCDYDNYFETINPLYELFIKSIFRIYSRNKLIVKKQKGKALNYNLSHWRYQCFPQINKTKFLPEKAKKAIFYSAKELDNNWSFERSINSGIGIAIDQKIIDPMFDSEMLGMFSAIYPLLKTIPIKYINEELFIDLFDEIKTKKDSFVKKKDNKIAKEIINKLKEVLRYWLPVDIYFVEEHLQTGIAKQIYSETFLLPPQLRTKMYFILGSITLMGKPMSASKGHAILLPDLIKKYGPIVTRLLLLTSGGHPSKYFEWNPNLAERIRRSSYRLIKHIKFIKKINIDDKARCHDFIKLIQENKKILSNLFEKGHFNKAAIEFLDVLPSKIASRINKGKRKISYNCKQKILGYFVDKLNIFCPALVDKLIQ